MKIIIATEPDDVHALLVKIALEKIGHQVRLMFTADQPTKLKNSVLIDNDTFLWRSTDKHDSIVESDYDVMWWRRARKPSVPKYLTHADDYQFVQRENMMFSDSLTNNIAPNAWWVNNKVAAQRANSKLLQLKLAKQFGMIIPTTLCSNDPQDIRYFILKHEAEGVIYKPFCSNSWFENEQIKLSYTSKISFLELPNNQVLQLTPGIYQKEVKKSYELRVNCFGDYIVAVKINSQANKAGKVDWRAIPAKELMVESYQLPTTLEDKIRKFMCKLGIVFGAFDFIVNEDNEYVFVELNEQGQFLWIEELNPDIHLLDIFVNFLVNKTRAFKWKPKSTLHTTALYQEKGMELMAYNMQHHVELNSAEARQI